MGRPPQVRGAGLKVSTGSSDKTSMKFRFLLLALPLLLWQCATPAPAPPPEIPRPVPIPLPEAPPPPKEPDDDHKSVTREAFQASPWAALPAVKGWKAEPAGVTVTLADGRDLTLIFVGPGVLRWIVPAAAGEAPLSPSARYQALTGVTVKVKEGDGVVFLETPGISARLNLADLSWSVHRGEKTVLRTMGGPRVAGRRINQVFVAADAAKWFGLGLSAEQGSAKYWVTDENNPEKNGPFAAPVLFGAGGAIPFALSLDNSYQTYTRLTPTEASLGSLNGGLDLLMAAAPQTNTVLDSLTALTGRPGILPSWAHGTILTVPPAEKASFLRKAKLSIQAVAVPDNPAADARLRFQTLLQSPLFTDRLPDLTVAAQKAAWVSSFGIDTLTFGTGLALPAIPGRQDWDTSFDDAGQNSPLARMNNRLPGLSAQAVFEAWKIRNPGVRPLLLAGSGGLGSIRYALPELKVTAGSDEGVLAKVLTMGLSGLGTPAIRLDLTPLTQPETRAAAFHSLAAWLFIPVLTLDWGLDPAIFWTSLSDPDRLRLKALLDRRSQFKPYLAQNTRQAAATGRPAWLPIWASATSDTKALACDDEFLWGESLLVAPVSGSSPQRSVYLPGPGVWFDFWSGEEFGGGQSYDLEARPDKPLLFARGGAFVPVREPEVFDDKDIFNPLTVHVFPGGRGMGAYYLDDGRTLASGGGVYWETRLVYDYAQKDMTLDHETLNTTGALLPDPYLLYRLHNVFRPKQVQINGKPIPLYGDSWGITDTDRSAAWYESDHSLLLKTFRPEKSQTIVMSF